jgi:hypothetical protein
MWFGGFKEEFVGREEWWHLGEKQMCKLFGFMLRMLKREGDVTFI